MTSVALGRTRRRRRRGAGVRVLKYAALVFAAIVVLLPIYVLLVASSSW